MNAEQFAVFLFHQLFGIWIEKKPTIPPREVCDLRVELIRGELEELKEAFDNEDITAIADALADLLYVVYGAGVSTGIDLEEVFAEVHESNMTKVGRHKREDGKWIKPASYRPPNLKKIIERQQLEGE